MTPKETAEFLKARDGYLILTHVRPDGDTIGCAAGLCRSLRQMGKEAYVLHNPEATSLFTPYLEGLVAPQEYEPETVVAVDMAARGLFPDNAKQYLERVDLTIDHHPSQEFYAKHTCLDAKRAACGELMYEIMQLLGPVTPEMGEALYVAVSTDCGCFVYSNTTPATHRVAAALMETGFDPYPVNRRHFRTKSFKRLKIEGMLASGIELRDNGETALVFLTLDMFREVGANERDIDDISAFVGQVEGVKTGVTLRELRPGECKLSLRTDPGDLDASAVCAILGGGGHAAAAGATIEGTMNEAREAVLAAIETVRQG